MGRPMTETPSISIIVPAWNASKYLRRAVESVLATHYPKLEIIVVDDASTDDTWKVCNQIKQSFPAVIRLFQRSSREPRGAGAARNLGIEKSTGDYIAFLDADDWVYPWRFESAVRELSRYPTVDAVYGDYDIVCEEGHARDLFVSATVNQLPSNDGVSFSGYVDQGLWSTDTIFLRRSLFDKAGLFDVTFAIGQDVHLWYRMVLVGVIRKSEETRNIVAVFRHPGNRWIPGYRDSETRCRVLMSVWKWAASHCSEGKTDEVYWVWRKAWAAAVVSKIRYHDFSSARQLFCEAMRGLKWGEYWNALLYRELLIVLVASCRHGAGYWVHRKHTSS